MTYNNGEGFIGIQGKPLSLQIPLTCCLLAEGWGLPPYGGRNVPALPFGTQTHLSIALHKTEPLSLSLLCSPLHNFPLCSVPSPEMYKKSPNRIE